MAKQKGNSAFRRVKDTKIDGLEVEYLRGARAEDKFDMQRQPLTDAQEKAEFEKANKARRDITYGNS